MNRMFLCLALSGLLALSGSVAGQNDDLGRKVQAAFVDAREKRFAKAAALSEFGKKLFPFLELYIDDPSDDVRDLVVALVRKQTSPEALEILSRLLRDRENYIGEKAMDAVHNEYTCDQVRASRYAKEGLKEYLARRSNSARAALLLSCFTHDPEIAALIAAKRKDSGTHGDGGIHHGVPFNLSVELALAQLGDAPALLNCRAYIAHADKENLFFILDNIKFVESRELRLALVELLHDKRPVYQPISHSNFYLRICDLALTALSTTDPTLITMDHRKQRLYSDEELKAAYKELKARF